MNNEQDNYLSRLGILEDTDPVTITREYAPAGTERGNVINGMDADSIVWDFLEAEIASEIDISDRVGTQPFVLDDSVSSSELVQRMINLFNEIPEPRDMMVPIYNHPFLRGLVLDNAASWIRDDINDDILTTITRFYNE